MISQEAQWLLKEKYDGAESEAFRADLTRLEGGEPLAFVIGHIPFLETTIYLDGHPLIPRVETEYWVSEAIKEIRGFASQSPRILDLCAGSGCIGVAVANAIPQSVVHFAEYDTRLHTTIAQNIKQNKIEEHRTQILGGDLFDEITETYDFILSNPPYLPEGSTLIADSVKKYEPPLALYGGANGLDVIKRMLTTAKPHLNKDGILYIEHEPDQSEAITLLAKQHNFTCTTHTDQYKTPRYSRIAVAQ